MAVLAAHKGSFAVIIAKINEGAVLIEPVADSGEGIGIIRGVDIFVNKHGRIAAAEIQRAVLEGSRELKTLRQRIKRGVHIRNGRGKTNYKMPQNAEGGKQHCGGYAYYGDDLFSCG